jgi:hypothetical protein
VGARSSSHSYLDRSPSNQLDTRRSQSRWTGSSTSVADPTSIRESGCQIETTMIRKSNSPQWQRTEMATKKEMRKSFQPLRSGNFLRISVSKISGCCFTEWPIEETTVCSGNGTHRFCFGCASRHAGVEMGQERFELLATGPDVGMN